MIERYILIIKTFVPVIFILGLVYVWKIDCELKKVKQKYYEQ